MQVLLRTKVVIPEVKAKLIFAQLCILVTTKERLTKRLLGPEEEFVYKIGAP
jgi:hypothetical protein